MNLLGVLKVYASRNGKESFYKAKDIELLLGLFRVNCNKIIHWLRRKEIILGRYFNKVNTSPKQKKIKKRLEEIGNTDVEVWWEQIESACEMCGNGGGYFFSSEEYTLEPIGYSFEEAIEYIEHFKCE